MNAEEALRWTDTDERELSDESYHRIGDLLNDSDPEVAKVSMGLLSLAKRSPDYFDFADEHVGVEFTQQDEDRLISVIGAIYKPNS